MIVSQTRFCTDNAIKYLIGKYCPENNVAILDVGCGKGQYYQYFTPHVQKGFYLGIDIKARKTWQAREENGRHLSFLVHDSEKPQNLTQKQKFNFFESGYAAILKKSQLTSIKKGG